MPSRPDPGARSVLLALPRPETPQPLLRLHRLRAVEAEALAEAAPGALMHRAGAATARLALAVAPHAPAVRVLCGRGHNGGDGLVAAAELARAGRPVQAWLAPPERAAAALPPAVAAALGHARDAGVQVLEGGPPDPPASDPTAADDALWIDALLGIGIRQAPRGAVASGIRSLRLRAGTRHGVLGVDLPSGLDGDTGSVPGDAVIARHTITFIAAKPGLFTAAGRDHSGRAWLDELGLGAAVREAAFAQSPRAATDPADPDPDRAGPCALLPWPWADAFGRPMPHASHKGRFGDVVVVGGAPGMAGAAELAARAAHAAGAGRMYRVLLGPDPTGGSRPELMSLDLQAVVAGHAASGRTVVAGCGGGAAIGAVLEVLLQEADRLVLDADALNALASDPGGRQRLLDRAGRGQPTVLTPHPLEAARLLGCSTAAVQADRPAAARQLARLTGAVALLKGSGTVIAAPRGVAWINPTGSAALATPGSGDVLAGWIGGLWSRGEVQAGPLARVSLDWAGTDATEAGLLAACAACALQGAVAETVAHGPLRAGDLIEAMQAARASGRISRSG